MYSKGRERESTPTTGAGERSKLGGKNCLQLRPAAAGTQLLEPAPLPAKVCVPGKLDWSQEWDRLELRLSLVGTEMQG